MMTTTNLAATVRHLQGEVTRLETRIRTLEGHAGMASPPEPCPECEGRGSFPAGSRNPDKRPLACELCRGTGRCPEGYWDDDWEPGPPKCDWDPSCCETAVALRASATVDGHCRSGGCEWLPVCARHRATDPELEQPLGAPVVWP